MQTHRKTIINTILEADELLLLASEEKKELKENYKAINQIMPVSNLTELKFEQK
jgi:hypothetical protein